MAEQVKPTVEQEAAAEKLLEHARMHISYYVPTVLSIAALIAERDALAKFKAYVHQRLDEAGVPADPDSPHKSAGCRIGGRLDLVLAERDAARAERDRLIAAMREKISNCCGDEAGKAFCEMYGCGTLLDLIALAAPPSPASAKSFACNVCGKPIETANSVCDDC